MALKAGEGLQRWEIAVTKKLVGEFRRRSRSLAREEFDDLMQLSLQAGTIKAPIAFERYVDERFVKATQPARIAL